jgi:hypothetical protein
MSDWVLPAGRIPDDPGKMDDSFCALEGVAKKPDVSNVTIKDFDLFFYFLEWLSTPQKAIKNAHFVAASEQLLDYARADVARTPGHKHAHDITSLAPARQHPVGPRTPGCVHTADFDASLHGPVVRLATGDCSAPAFVWAYFSFTRPPPACHKPRQPNIDDDIRDDGRGYSATSLANGRRRDNLITRSSARALLLLDPPPACPGRNGRGGDLLSNLS